MYKDSLSIFLSARAKARSQPRDAAGHSLTVDEQTQIIINSLRQRCIKGEALIFNSADFIAADFIAADLNAADFIAADFNATNYI